MNQMKFPVITIAREYGAGGRSVASLLAEKLNVPGYDYNCREFWIIN